MDKIGHTTVLIPPLKHTPVNTSFMCKKKKDQEGVTEGPCARRRAKKESLRCLSACNRTLPKRENIYARFCPRNTRVYPILSIAKKQLPG